MTSSALVNAYIHHPTPPYQVLAGPIPIVSQTRRSSLTARNGGTATFAITDISADWFRVGMPIGIESRSGLEYWLGFVKDESWELGATAITVPLIGLIEALLQVNFPTAEMGPTGADGLVRNAIIHATRVVGSNLQVGRFETSPAVSVPSRGVTARAYVQQVASSAGRFLRENTTRGAQGMELSIDFGLLRRQTKVILTREDITQGVYRRTKPIRTLTVIGAATSFASRATVTVGIHGQDGVPQSSKDKVAGKDIGPGATIDVTTVNPTSQEGLDRDAQTVFEDRLRAVDELYLTLDLSRPSVQNIRLGDIVRVNVAGWNTLFGINTQIQIVEMRPYEEKGVCDVVGEIL